MDKNTIIKLTLIDIFPSLEEIEHNNKEDISIIFQGINIFYNLKDILLNKKDIYIKKHFPKNTLMISLVQSINILATGILTIKTGKQWVTFSYENKKKSPSSNLALSLMNCIKINISCLVIYNNTENFNNININNNNTNKLYNKNIISKKDTRNNLAQKKNKKNLNSKIIKNNNLNNKHRYNNSHERYLINSYNYNGRESLYSTENDKKINFKIKKDSNYMKNMSSFSTIGKENKKFDLNSSLSLSSNKYNNMSIIEQNKKIYSTIRQKIQKNNKANNSSNDNQSYNINDFEIEPKIEIKEEHNLFKKNKTNKQQFKLNPMHKKQKSCNTFKIIENKTNLRYRNSGEKSAFKNNNDSNKKIAIINTDLRKNSKNRILSNNKYPYNIDRNNLYNMSSSLMNNSYLKKNELMNSFQKDNNGNILNNNNDKDNFITEKKNFKNINLTNINNMILFNSNNKPINSEINNKLSENIIYDTNETMENILENDNYTKLKEDFLLLYTNEYVKNVKEDLLKLEIELFVEKMTELTREYHIQLYDKLLEYQLEKNKAKVNLYNFYKIKKLNNKLLSLKMNKDIKKDNIIENNKIFNKQNKDIFNINQNEISLYKYLFNDNSNEIIDNKNKLKKILSIILNKIEIKNIINPNDKNYKYILNFLNFNKNLEIRTRIIPKNQQTKCNTSQSLTNSYILENYNDNNNLKDVHVKNPIFSPIIKIKEHNPNSINKINNNFDNN